jgi:hypothetical protein
MKTMVSIIWSQAANYEIKTKSAIYSFCNPLHFLNSKLSLMVNLYTHCLMNRQVNSLILN